MFILKNHCNFISNLTAVKRFFTSSSSVAVFSILLLLQTTAGCKKDKTKLTPVPFLTGRNWIADTILVTPPKTYNQLSTADQQFYNSSKAWFRNALIRFNEDGTATPGGDYDLAYKSWKLINNNKDIEIIMATGAVLILRDWTADNAKLAYVVQLNNSFDATLVFK